MEIAVLLENVRSAHNVGAILRTADAAAVSKVYLGGYTPSPQDRFGRLRKDIQKASLGAEETVAWESVTDIPHLLQNLKSEGWHIAGVEQDARAIDYRAFSKKERVVLIFGNEVEGLSENTRSNCDSLLEIPQYGTKESLNVSTAAGIVLFSLR